MQALFIFSRTVVGITLAVSICAKLRTKSAYIRFEDWVHRLAVVPSWATTTTAILVIAAEVTAAGLIAAPWTAEVGLFLSAFLLAGFSLVVLLLARRGIREPCLCFGSGNQPMTFLHAVRDAVLASIALVGALLAGGRTPSLGAITTAVATAIVVATLLISSETLVSILHLSQRTRG
jgi:hypothetical protein